MDKNLLILTEAGEGIGFGHYFRCQALREYFQEQGSKVHMLLDLKGNYDFVEEKISWRENNKKVEGYSGEYPFVLVDSYLAGEEYYSFLSGIFKKTIVIDDYNRLPYKSDLIINPNIYGNELEYPNASKILAGKDFVILRKPFRDATSRYNAREEVRKVMITLGGSDVRNLIPFLIEYCSSMQLEVTVIAGNEEYKNQLDLLYKSFVNEIIGFADAGQMLGFMLNSDLVISACGQTLHELAYLGIPTIGICIGDDQISNLKRYNKSGFLSKEIYWNSKDLKTELASSFNFLRNKKAREDVSLIGRNEIKGDGVKNIYYNIFYV